MQYWQKENNVLYRLTHQPKLYLCESVFITFIYMEHFFCPSLLFLELPKTRKCVTCRNFLVSVSLHVYNSGEKNVHFVTIF